MLVCRGEERKEQRERGGRGIEERVCDDYFSQRATKIKYQVNPVIFLLKNYGYTIEEETHKGPYKQNKNWDYAGM
jgi:hypothetical protein